MCVIYTPPLQYCSILVLTMYLPAPISFVLSYVFTIVIIIFQFCSKNLLKILVWEMSSGIEFLQLRESPSVLQPTGSCNSTGFQGTHVWSSYRARFLGLQACETIVVSGT